MKERNSTTSLSFTSQPRSALPQHLHGEIDLFLKDLKIDTRRLQSVVAAHTDESQILERIYYKGKNQHRSALFWRRVAEIRRYCDSLRNVNISAVVNRLRYCFFGPEALQTPAFLKGSWTHFPTLQSINNALKELSECSTLVEKMCNQMLGAYRSFVISMQSGAFLQILLALVAIASRLHALSSELREILGHIGLSLNKVLLIITSNMAVDSATISQSKTLEASKSSLLPGPSALDINLDPNESAQNNTQEAVNAANYGDIFPTAHIQSGKSRIVIVNESRIEPEVHMSRGSSASLRYPNEKTKKKRPKTIDEIDAIFGV
ncbi:hypothetical protein BDQ12DRAFT_676510 [Crucibulum laeve]|uniref:Nucleolus and neural progenitor protein-like N-terminal domain-containing protein n=1 Tax=Crucibulum laeve TaxID=68775 RepID=A0A5C3MBC5_9AGAR|nr:hypothetical protein BDQ12DRAFT_676510 [Crucibulum laeve]